MDWRADQLQAVLFPAPGHPQMDALAAWMAAMDGVSPDGFQKPSFSPASTSFAYGVSNGLRTSIGSQIGRMDIMLNQELVDTTEPARFSQIDPVLQRLRSGSKKILSKIPVARLALIVTITSIFENENLVADAMSKECGLWVPKPPLDAVCQFNVRKHLSQFDANINRVLTYTAGSYSLHAMNEMQIQATPSFIFPILSLKIDINTLPSEVVSNADGIYDALEEEIVRLIDARLDGVRG